MVALCGSEHARAQWQGVARRDSAALSWDAPPDCVSPADARHQVEQHLGRSLALVPAALHARVTLRQLADEVLEARIVLRLGARRYERVLRDSRCEALARAAAIVVALTIDVAIEDRKTSSPSSNVSPGGAPASSLPSSTSVVGREPQLSESPQPESQTALAKDDSAISVATEQASLAPTRAAARREPTQPARVTRRGNARRRWPGDLAGIAGVAAGVSNGIVPGVSFPVSFFAGVLRGPFHLAGRASHLGPRWSRPDGLVGVRGSVALAAGALELGMRLRRGAFELPVVLGLEAGRFRATSQGTIDSRTVHAPWLAAQAGAELRYLFLQRLALLLRVSGSAALQRPPFALRAADGSLLVYHRPDLFAAQVALGAEVRFP